MPTALRPVPEEGPALEGARALAALRSQCQRRSTAWKNSLRATLLESCPAFERACDLSQPSCAELLARVGGPWQALAMGGRRFLAAAELAGNRDHGNLQTTPGVGPATAAQLVIDVDISDFPSEARPAGYCGVVPADRGSGTSVRGCSATRGGNRRLKNLLVFSCGSLQSSRSRLGDYFRACRSRGMPYKAALKATARKRMRVTCAVLRDGVPSRPRHGIPAHASNRMRKGSSFIHKAS